MMHTLARSRRPGLKKATLDVFLKHFKIDMSEYVESNPYAYESFNAFFTRALKPDARPIDNDAHAIVSPVDGTISQIGEIDDDAIIQAKGHNYSLRTLIANDDALTTRYSGGSFVCIYLAPYNYHRMHMPLTGVLTDTIYVPGALFSVNNATAQQVPNLFARNERVICDFKSASTNFAMVFVGALFVGSIETVWAGEINQIPRGKKIVCVAQGKGMQLDKGAEAGRFNMGSTVVLLIEPGRAKWLSTLQSGSTVKLGERIGTLS